MASMKDVQKYKLTLSLDLNFARKFAAFAGFTGEDMSAIASRAIRKEMKGFQVGRTDVGDDQAEGQDSSLVRLAVRGEEQRDAG